MNAQVELEEVVDEESQEDSGPERIDLLAHYGTLARSRDEANFVSMGQRLGVRVAQAMARYCGHSLYQSSAIAVPEQAAASADDIYIAHFQIEDTRDPLCLLVSPVAIERVIAALFGADESEILAAAPILRPEQTHVDRAVLERVVTELESAIGSLMRDVPGIALAGRTGKLVQMPADSLDLDSGYVAIHLESEGVTTTSAEVSFLIPRQAAARLARGVASSRRSAPERASWRTRLRAAVMDIELEARAPIAHFHMPLARVLTLSDGEEIAIAPTGAANLSIDGIPIAAGEPGEQHGQRAVRLTKLHTAPTISG